MTGRDLLAFVHPTLRPTYEMFVDQLFAWGFCHLWDAVAFGAHMLLAHPVLVAPSVLPDDIKLLPGAIIPFDEVRVMTKHLNLGGDNG